MFNTLYLAPWEPTGSYMGHHNIDPLGHVHLGQPVRPVDHGQYGEHLQDLMDEHHCNPNGRSHIVEVPGMTDGTSRRHHLSAQDDAAQFAYSNRKTAVTGVDGGARPLGAITIGMLTKSGPVYSHSIWRVDRRGHGSSQSNGQKAKGKAKPSKRINAAAPLTNAEKQARHRALAKWRKAALAEGYVCPEHGAPVQCKHPCREQALALSSEGTVIVDTGPETWASKG